MTTTTIPNHNKTQNSPVFQLKGGLYTLTALQIQHPDFSRFAEELDSKIQQAPKFFQYAPVVIDLQKIAASETSIDFTQLKETLTSRRLVPVGVKGGSSEQHNAASLAGLALLPDTTKEKTTATSNQSQEKSNANSTEAPTKTKGNSSASTSKSEEEFSGTPTRVITEPVRSGQQIYAQGGDLIVLAPVSQGSELLADGHIHVYGPLRGRALAGVTGDVTARIFCQSLEAELISIAGQYKISEDIERFAWQIAAHISIKNGRLHISEL